MKANDFGSRSWSPTGLAHFLQSKHEVIGHEELFLALHDHLPPEMIYERELLICRL